MALTKNRSTASTPGHYIVMDIADSATIYHGAMVANAAGKAVPAAKAADQPGLGVACLVGNGKVTIERGAHLWDNDATNPVTAAHIGSSCYIADDCTVTALATGSSIAGKVLGFEDGQVIVVTL